MDMDVDTDVRQGEAAHASSEDPILAPHLTAVCQLAVNFIHDSGTSKKDLDALERFLSASPRRIETEYFIADIEERQALAGDIQEAAFEENIRNSDLKAALWAGLMVADIHKLRELRDKACDEGSTNFNLTTFIKTCTSTLVVLIEMFRNKASTSSNPQLLRSKSETERDKLCIITKKTFAENIHIFPPNIQKPRPGFDTSFLRYIMPDNQVNCLDKLIDYAGGFPSPKNDIDRTNAISLDPVLGHQWAEGYFGLCMHGTAEMTVEEVRSKPEGRESHKRRAVADEKTIEGISLVFRWLGRQRSIRPLDPMPLDADPRETNAHYSLSPLFGFTKMEAEGTGSVDWLDRFSQPIVINNVKTGRPIDDGEVIEMFTNIPSHDLLALQYDVVRMVNLTGADGTSYSND